MMITKAGWHQYRLCSFTGTVKEMGKDFVIFTFGRHRNKEYAVNNKWLPPVRVENATNAFNYIFLSDKNGKEMSVHLSDFTIACREGHELTAIWAVKQGNEYGHYIAIRNNTTEQTFFSQSGVTRMFGAPLFIYLLIIPCTFITGYFFSHHPAVACISIFPGILVSWLIGREISKAAVRKFIAGFRNNVIE